MKSMTALGGLISLLLFPACDQHGPSPAQIEVTTVPSVVYTVTEGIVKQSGAGSDTQDLSWLFHIVFTSREGVPSLFSDFERVIPGMAPQNIALGNPRTGWLVRPIEKTPQPTS